MEYIVIIAISIIILGIVWLILGISLKEIKKIGENEELDKLTNSFPENIEICKSILNKLGNTHVTIKEEKDNEASLYVIVNNTITIANIRKSYTRVQTIAHECIHSTQSKKMLWFNFVFTNIYLLYFLVISILTIMNIIPNPMLFLCILIIMGLVQYSIRSMLETDAMTKARYVAKEYLEENEICSKEDIEKIVTQYDKLNTPGIKFVNFDILVRNILKVIIYSIVAII